MESLDVFLSHSWQAPGKWKILGLVLQTGWPHGLLGWLLFTIASCVLRALDLVQAPVEVTIFIAQAQRPQVWSYFPLLAGSLGLVLGVALSPYLPSKRSTCFLDLACVHQGDPELLERGIRNIGGCLSVSSELHVLYHPAYFSSRLSESL